jgi:glycerol-3-phosphate dehydrogenase
VSVTRPGMLKRFREHTGAWDIIIIGGGATGVGVAVDAASRGYKTLLLEGSDFGKGTSSRSTKLVHGGVRYLEQGDIPLVMEALKERGLLRQNAPHLVTNLAFVVPSYEWWEGPFYGVGLRLYNMLAGKYGFGPSKNLSKEETLERLPTIEKAGLRGGVVYYDGQFDDSRLLLNLVQTAAEQGATLLNYAPVTGFVFGEDGLVDGVLAKDAETGATLRAEAKVVINATGAFGDNVRKLAAPKAQDMIAPSQGIHVVLDRSFLPGDTAIMVPHTSDGRVMFAIPWHGHTLVGTTDTPIAEATLEPRALSQEIDFLLETTTLYLDRAVTRADVLSVFSGIRPLVKSGGGGITAALSRSHTVHIDESGLLTITGGKWTTYRNMAEDCVNHATTLGKLEERPCITRQLKVHGYDESASEHGHLRVYGSDAEGVLELAAADPTLAAQLHPDLPYTAAQVVFAARHEMARTVDDVLSRRLRATFLNARAAIAMAPRVAELLAKELGRDDSWRAEQERAFTALAEGYLP